MASSSTTPQIYNQQTTDRWELSIPITRKNFVITEQWIIIQYIDIVRGNHWLRIRVRHSSWKGSRAEMPLIKFIGATNRQSPVIARKFLPLCHRNHQIRMRFEERDDLLCKWTGCPTQTDAFSGLGQLLLHYQGVEYTYMKCSTYMKHCWVNVVFSGFQNQQASSHKIIRD